MNPLIPQLCVKYNHYYYHARMYLVLNNPSKVDMLLQHQTKPNQMDGLNLPYILVFDAIFLDLNSSLIFGGLPHL